MEVIFLSIQTPQRVLDERKMELAQFNLLWLIVLCTGLIMFYQIGHLPAQGLGGMAYVAYLTTTLYHLIQAIPSFVASIQVLLKKTRMKVPSKGFKRQA